MNTPALVLVGRASLLASSWLLSAVAFADEHDIRVVTDKEGKGTCVAVNRLSDLESARAKAPEYASRIFTVHVTTQTGELLPAMLGSYQVEFDELRFTPKFSFRPGTEYRAVLQLQDEKLLSKDFVIPEAVPGERTRVAAIYPSLDVLPENLLKFYIHFSRPMSRGEAYQHLKLVMVDGKEVDTPFLELGEELWNGAGTRLTVFIDPGRIKKGVKPREDLGPALVQGKEYRLLVAEGWRDAAGKPLTAGFEKRFKTGPAVETEIDFKDWKIQPPAAGTRTALRLQFTRPLDAALLERTIHVLGPDGKPVEGKSVVTENERAWDFKPEVDWSPGVNRIVVDTVLEDLAGNRIGKAFEVDELRPLDKVIDVVTVEAPFLVK